MEGTPPDPTPGEPPVEPSAPPVESSLPADSFAAPEAGQPAAEVDDQPAVAAAPPGPPPKKQINPVLELALILLAAVGLWWAGGNWFVKPYRIPSASMEPTLRSGDRVLVSRFIYRFHDPRRGDVIVFHPPGTGDTAVRGAKTEASVYYIKRIIGLPGETVEGMKGHVEICSAPQVGCHVLKEPYLAQGTMTDFAPVRVPQGQYFMMGDNRAVSDDSRYWGTLPRANIIGEAFATYWPLDRLRTL
ncbi:MAG: signal peptidase [Gaiellales bacterium]|nr:signal peptidase [Gaiellales bacterium]MDX6545585.1 signal peptidase [Gaiellales bacterium]MDX6549596.1 signal peptidase [Gaiellales bacterium]